MPIKLKMYECTSLSFQSNLNFLFELRNSNDFILLILSKKFVFLLIEHVLSKILPKINLLHVFIEFVPKDEVFVRV